MLAPDGWSGGVFVGGVLDYMMVVVSDNSVWKFLGDFRLLLALPHGLRWRGDMGSPKKSENTNF